MVEGVMGSWQNMPILTATLHLTLFSNICLESPQFREALGPLLPREEPPVGTDREIALLIKELRGSYIGR